MQNERKRILTMLENGKITMDEALTLLENLSETDPVTKPESAPADHTMPTDFLKKESEEDYQKQFTKEDPPKEKENSSKYGRMGDSAEEFMEDIRKDLTNVGDQFMQFMQTAVQKVKEFDIENPFGSAVRFEHSLQKDGKDVEELILDIDNGKLSIVPGEGDEISAVFSVKTFTSNSEEEAKKEFMEKLICVADESSFRISSNSKTVQVNTTLTVPKKTYRKISVRLLNGGFDVRNLEANLIRVKTANGKVSASYVKSDEVEIETLNGEIRLLSIDSTKLDAQTVNGLIYIDGKVKETEARTLNGAISVTTTHESPEKVDVKSVGGNIELYVPSTLSLVGGITSTIGSLSLKLPDVEKTSNQDQLLHRSINFKKDVSDSPSTLHLFAESKTGSVVLCYNPEKNV
ncbi:DUF4097 family beta strand repeat-containing protein [Sporosarcina sp. A2]|uniref:DUF4097 family beta strand repeat-containing protein n=1 Tax=Sporosarcina sp. A2 TaxID=3393449 RepID=UPI003D794AC2